MQIDFHHTVTYVAARFAGFDHADADIIAYAAQYVDDATADGAVCFDNNAMYRRISSAHRTKELDNLRNTENHVVWLPFHFLPGNDLQPAETTLDHFGGKFINKMVCRPDSPVAREMVEAAIDYQADHHGNSLHRLGITMHVYADTWAHQGFAGVLHEINEVINMSWKAQALGTSDEQREYRYKDSFLTSNWKKFHDAIQLHRLTLLHKILPKYGICAG